MKKIIILLLCLSILQLSLTNALGPVGENGIDISVQNNTIQIQGYTIVAAPPYGVPTKFVSSSSFFVNSTSESLGTTQSCVNFNYTSGNQTISIPTNCTYSVNYLKSLPFITNMSNQSTTTLVDITTQNKYDQCVLERAQYQTSYNNCLEAKNAMNSFESNYTNCKEQLNACQSQLTGLQSQISTLTKEKDDSKNTPYVVGVICFAIGAGGVYWYTNNKSKIKHPEENYNRGQSA